MRISYFASILFIISSLNALVIRDNKTHKKFGYGACNIEKNGEGLVLKTFVKPNMVLFDIGASTGDWTEYVLSINKNLSVFSFEPIPHIHKKLKKTFKNQPNVQTYNIGIDQKVGHRTFYHCAKTDRISRLSGFYKRESVVDELGEKEIQVNTDTIDNFCNKKNIDHIDILKIDTEGAEFDVLKGAENLLTQNKISIIQFEYGGCYVDSKITLKEVYEYLTHYNFKIYRIFEEGLIHISQWDNSLENYIYSNYLAIHQHFR